jgi:hypothetical protein
MDKPIQTEDFTLEKMTEMLQEYFYGKDINPIIEPDISITESDTLFMVAIHGSVHTGYGGLKMYFNGLPSVSFLKISYNGKILNPEEKEELFNKIKFNK